MTSTAPSTGPRPASTPAWRGEDRDELQLLLRLRYRLRVDLGMPEDDYDKLLDDKKAGPAAGTLNSDPPREPAFRCAG